MNYIEIDCTVNSQETGREILIALLADGGCDSFEETDEGVKAYISKDCYKKEQLDEILEKCSRLGFPCSCKVAEMRQENWNAVWESNYESVVIDEQCRVRAPFHPAGYDVKYEIVIEPKMSFGTAHHETTALMISYLLTEDCEGKSVLDMGSGTGILAILAAKSGAKRVLAIDNDHWAYENCKENIERNNVRAVEPVCGDADSIKDAPYDIVAANINRNILLQDMKKYVQAMQSGSILLLSGFYQDQDLPILTEEAAKNNLRLHSFKEKNKWAAAKFVFVFMALFLCVSACKTKSHLPKPARKKKCDCPHFSEITPPQSVYFVNLCVVCNLGQSVVETARETVN
ncbi:MAG: 50S ribosomal protein L11 methyltransferase [Lentimicrobiaceae bacterium]|nr:50S ribosomal protein L11 methyltransferase [Lentimicrobiaceae bacterium]